METKIKNKLMYGVEHLREGGLMFMALFSMVALGHYLFYNVSQLHSTVYIYVGIIVAGLSFFIMPNYKYKFN